jgi:hypothetical protein
VTDNADGGGWMDKAKAKTKMSLKQADFFLQVCK